MSPKQSKLCSPYVRSTIQLGVVIATVLSALMLLNISATAKITYAIDDGDQQLTLASNSTDLSEVLDQAGVDRSELDLVDTTANNDVVNVSVTHRQYVTVVCDGVTTSMLAKTSDTAADVLEHLNITLGEFDQLSVPADTVLGGEVTELNVNRATVTYKDESTPIPYKSVREANPDMMIGEETVTTQGQEGNYIEHYRTVTMEDGTVTTELMSTDTVEAVNEVTSYGTKTEYSAPTNALSTSSEYITNIDEEAGTITTSRGNVYAVSKKLTLNSTAYTAGPGAICSTGRVAQVGVVAVDPKYISYGTEMFIMTEDGSFVYGKCVAGDCGGAIDDNDVDLYMHGEQTCRNWGRRNVTAYVITDTITEG